MPVEGYKRTYIIHAYSHEYIQTCISIIYIHIYPYIAALGDGKFNEGQSNFPDIVRAAADKKINVVIYAWRQALSFNLKYVT